MYKVTYDGVSVTIKNGQIPHCNTECKNISGINTGWQWRGVCPENTKDNIDKEEDDHEISM